MIDWDVSELLERGTIGALLEERQKESQAYRSVPGQGSPAPCIKTQQPLFPAALCVPRFILLSFAKSNFIRQFYCQPLNQNVFAQQ